MMMAPQGLRDKFKPSAMKGTMKKAGGGFGGAGKALGKALGGPAKAMGGIFSKKKSPAKGGAFGGLLAKAKAAKKPKPVASSVGPITE